MNPVQAEIHGLCDELGEQRFQHLLFRRAVANLLGFANRSRGQTVIPRRFLLHASSGRTVLSVVFFASHQGSMCESAPRKRD